MIEAIPQFPNLPNLTFTERDYLIQALEFVFCDRADSLAAIAEMSEDEAYEHVYAYINMLESQFEMDNPLEEDFN